MVADPKQLAEALHTEAGSLRTAGQLIGEGATMLDQVADEVAKLRRPAPPKPLAPIGVGMGGNIGDAKMAAAIAAAGITHVRWALTWPSCVADNGQLQLPARARAWAQALTDAGIEQTVCLTYCAGKYAHPAAVRAKLGQFSMPTDIAAWQAFVAFAVRELTPLGVKRWEVWNEPNHGGQLPNGGTVTPGLVPIKNRTREYGQLVLTAAAELPRAHTVLVGALSPAPDRAPSAMAPVTFLQQLYDEYPGIGSSFDRLSDHPYSGDQPLGVVAPWAHVSTLIPKMLQVMADAGDGGKLVDATEAGWVTGPDANGRTVTEARQAELVVDAVSTWRAQSWAGVLFIFAWQDLRNGPAFGLTRGDGSAKPALAALSEVLAA